MISNPDGYEFTNVNRNFISGVDSQSTMMMRLEHLYWWNEITRTAEVCGSIDPQLCETLYRLGMGSKDSVEEMVPNINHILHKHGRPEIGGWADRLNAVITEPVRVYPSAFNERVINIFNDVENVSLSDFTDYISVEYSEPAVVFPDNIVPGKTIIDRFYNAAQYITNNSSYPSLSGISRSNTFTGVGGFAPSQWWNRVNQPGFAFPYIFNTLNGHWNTGYSPEYTYYTNQSDYVRPFNWMHNYPVAVDEGLTGMYFTSRVSQFTSGNWAWEEDKYYGVGAPPWSYSPYGQLTQRYNCTDVNLIVMYRLLHCAIWMNPRYEYKFAKYDKQQNVRYILNFGSYWFAHREGTTTRLYNSGGYSNEQIGNRCCDLVNLDSLPSIGPYNPEDGDIKIGNQAYVNPYAVYIVATASARRLGV